MSFRRLSQSSGVTPARLWLDAIRAERHHTVSVEHEQWSAMNCKLGLFHLCSNISIENRSKAIVFSLFRKFDQPYTIALVVVLILFFSVLCLLLSWCVVSGSDTE